MKHIESPKAIQKPKNSIARKMLEDNRLVTAYILGKASIEEVKAKDIKFAKPL